MPLTYHESNNTITKTDWNKFKSIVRIKRKDVNYAEEIEVEIGKLEKVIVEAKSQTTIKQQRPKIKPMPHKIRKLIIKKDKDTKNYKHTLHPADKRIVNHLTHKVKTQINQTAKAQYRRPIPMANDQSMVGSKKINPEP